MILLAKKLELVRYDRYSNSGGTKEKFAIYKVMKSSGMGEIDILIEFGGGNYQTGKFEFYKESDYPVNSSEDLKQFYVKKNIYKCGIL